MARESGYERIYLVVRRIPRGRVATYGQIAKLAGIPGHARQVGYALHALPARSRVPWYRVINTKGQISLRSAGESTQRVLLEKEGILFDDNNRVPFELYGWLPADGRYR
jgi:methylated-DNA-protein-cysteine methyltransferase related protein